MVVSFLQWISKLKKLAVIITIIMEQPSPSSLYKISGGGLHASDANQIGAITWLLKELSFLQGINIYNKPVSMKQKLILSRIKLVIWRTNNID